MWAEQPQPSRTPGSRNPPSFSSRDPGKAETAGVRECLGVYAESIPAELQRRPWVLWRAEPRPGDKPAKVPYMIADPARRASSTGPATWGLFADAVEAYGALVELPPDPVRGPVVGIGVVLTGDGVVCLDLDDVLGSDGLDPRAVRVVERCASWTEISSSGAGLHVFVLGTVPYAMKGPGIEVYGTGRYIAVTGHVWPGSPADLRRAQPYLDALAQLDAENQTPRRHYSGPEVRPPDDLAGALLAMLERWGVPVARLKRWSDGFLIELIACPWSHEHTTGRDGAAVAIHASGAFDFVCLHAHCALRSWRDFRALMEAPR